MGAVFGRDTSLARKPNGGSGTPTDPYTYAKQAGIGINAGIAASSAAPPPPAPDTADQMIRQMQKFERDRLRLGTTRQSTFVTANQKSPLGSS